MSAFHLGVRGERKLTPPCSALNPTFFKCPRCCSRNSPSRPEMMYTTLRGSAASRSSASSVAAEGTAMEGVLTIGARVPWRTCQFGSNRHGGKNTRRNRRKTASSSPNGTCSPARPAGCTASFLRFPASTCQYSCPSLPFSFITLSSRRTRDGDKDEGNTTHLPAQLPQ